MTGILLANPGDDVQTIEQLNEWRMNPLGQKEFQKALKDGVILCKCVSRICYMGLYIIAAFLRNLYWGGLNAPLSSLWLQTISPT